MSVAGIALARCVERSDLDSLREALAAYRTLHPDPVPDPDPPPAGAPTRAGRGCPGERGALLELAGGGALLLPTAPILCRVVGLGMEGEVGAGDFQRLAAFYRTGGVTPTLQACPYAHPSLLAGLAAHGWRATLWVQVFVRPLTPDDAAASPVPGIEVRRAGPEERERFARTVGHGFLGREPDPGEIETGRVAAGAASNVCFIARVDGAIAGGAALAVHGRLASFFGASTLPAFRRRGVQSALLAARLARAAASGCDLARVGTDPGGASQRNVERFGFRPAYTQLRFTPPPAPRA
ncbi:MAG: hypothetical protein HZC42_04855 [Candidatus Eisenbacteria bacterium]|nr:hypothetical protein [Candidatus Eisenbacteria bacterium]